VPVGGGGLLSGVAVALKQSRPSIRVYGIGPVKASSMDISFQKKHMEILHDMPETVAEGIRTPMVSQVTLDHALKYVDDIITVTDDEVMAALKLIWTRLKVVVEPSGPLRLRRSCQAGSRFRARLKLSPF